MYFCYFYPTGLDLERQRRPWLSFALMGLMVAAFAWQLWWPTLLRLHPWELVFYVGSQQPWTATTALFLHAGWLHLAGNLIYLAVFLPALEDRLGAVGVLMVFLVAGVGGNLAHGVASWQGWLGQGGLGILGASGSISGLLGFALVRIPYARVAVAYWVFAPLVGQNRAGRKLLPLPIVVVLWLLLQVGQAALASETGSSVSYPAHLGGFALGALLAMTLGGLREGRVEASLARARRYLERGEAWAAAGEFTDYLEQAPGDAKIRLEHARSLVMAGVRDQAQIIYRDVYRSTSRDGQWNLALSALAEGRRCMPGLGLTQTELATAAHRAEKIGDLDLAAKIYQDLVARGGRHPDSDRAWVRLVLLLHADPARREEAAGWLAQARQKLPPGPWRDHLDREFSPRSEACEDAAPVSRVPQPVPGS